MIARRRRCRKNQIFDNGGSIGRSCETQTNESKGCCILPAESVISIDGLKACNAIVKAYRDRDGGKNMASELTWSNSSVTLHLEKRPELTVIRDLNDYPATARCSACGEVMPPRQRWINSSAQNLAWFADQFRLHIEREHPNPAVFKAA